MALSIIDFSGEKIITKGEGCAIFNLTHKVSNQHSFLYMWIQDSDTSPAKKGDRWIAGGDVKSETGVITHKEWGWAQTWKTKTNEPAKIVPVTEEELTLAVTLLQKIQENPIFGYSEENELARYEYQAKKQ